MTRLPGIPPDIIADLSRRKKVRLDPNVMWAAVLDAIEFLESVIDGELPKGRGWRKEYPDVAKKIDGYRASLKFYRQLYGQLVKEGNTRGWR